MLCGWACQRQVFEGENALGENLPIEPEQAAGESKSGFVIFRHKSRLKNSSPEGYLTVLPLYFLNIIVTMYLFTSCAVDAPKELGIIHFAS